MVLSTSDGRHAVHAVVLAAGLSRRFGGTQKALYRVCGMSMLERSIRMLAATDVSTVSVITGHRSADVGAEVAEMGSLTAVRSLNNPKYDVWNNFYSVELACREAPPGDLVIINGDIVYARSALETALAPADAELVLAISDDDIDEEAMKVACEGETIRHVGKALPRTSSAGEFIGISRMTANARRWYVSLSEWSRTRGVTDIYYEDIYDALCGGLRAIAYPVRPDNWAEVDHVDDLERAQRVAGRLADGPV